VFALLGHRSIRVGFEVETDLIQEKPFPNNLLETNSTPGAGTIDLAKKAHRKVGLFCFGLQFASSLPDKKTSHHPQAWKKCPSYSATLSGADSDPRKERKCEWVVSRGLILQLSAGFGLHTWKVVASTTLIQWSSATIHGTRFMVSSKYLTGVVSIWARSVRKPA
jgi:hypothetical protein